MQTDLTSIVAKDIKTENNFQELKENIEIFHCNSMLNNENPEKTDFLKGPFRTIEDTNCTQI